MSTFQRCALTAALILAACLSVEAQQIDAGIFNPSDSTLELRLRPSATVTTLPFSNVVFTLRWPDPYGVHLGGPSSPTYAVSKQGGEQVSGVYRYQKFAAATAQVVTWAANSEIVIMTIPVLQTGQGSGTFELVNDAWTAANNSSFYAEVSGIDRTGSMYQSSIGGVPLPLRVTTLHAFVHDDQTVLRWQVDGITDCAGFLVERQVATQSWESLGMLRMNQRNDDGWYTFIDNLTSLRSRGEALRYRLLMLSSDGSSRYSPEVQVRLEGGAASDLHLEAFPNPNTGSVGISFVLSTDACISLSLVDMLGRRISILLDGELLPAGRHLRTHDTRGIANGRYFLVLTFGGRISTLPLILNSDN